MISTRRNPSSVGRSLAGPLRGPGRQPVWRRGVARKVAAALLLATATYLTLGALRPPLPDPGLLVVVAALDVPVGVRLSPDSVRTARVPSDVVPDGALTGPGQAVGSVTSAPLRSGEVLTDLRLSPAGALTGLDPGLRLAHLPLADHSLASALAPGMRVDVLDILDGDVVATDVLLVQRAVPAVGEGEGQSFLVAVTPEQAGALAAATGGGLPGRGITVTIRP